MKKEPRGCLLKINHGAASDSKTIHSDSRLVLKTSASESF